MAKERARKKITKGMKFGLSVVILLMILIVFACVWRWGTTEIRAKEVDYNKLEKELNDHYLVPNIEESEVTLVKIYFPEPSPESQHQIGQYNNLTLRYKYADYYVMDLDNGKVKGSICGTNRLLTEENKFEYQTITADNLMIYYKIDERIQIMFEFSGRYYSILVLNTDEAHVEYARYLYGKFQDEITTRES